MAVEVLQALKYRGDQLTVAPMLEVENFTNWKKRFMCHIVGIEPQFKNIFLNGPYVPMTADNQMNSVINCETTKFTWEDVILYHEGPYDMKESSQEYLNDLEEEFQERELLAKSKRQSWTSSVLVLQHPNHQWPRTNYEWDEEDVSLDDNEIVKVKVLMVLANDENVDVGKESARNGEWVKISMRKGHTFLAMEDNDERKTFIDYLCIDLNYVDEQINNIMLKHGDLVQELNTCKEQLIIPAESQIKVTDPSVTVTGSSAIDYDSANESLVCNTPLPLREKLAGAEPKGIIFNSNKEVVMIAPRVRDVYVLDMTSSAQQSCFFAKASERLTYHITFDESTKAIKFSKPLVDDINIVDSGRYPPDEYLHPYEPSRRFEAIRIFLAFATYMNFTLYQMNVKSAFLNGKLKEEVYVKQPSGFESSEFPNHIFKLDKALYGLKQAPRAWYLKGTISLGLWYPKCSGFDLKGYSDFDYAGCNMDRKSTSAFTAEANLGKSDPNDSISKQQDKSKSASEGLDTVYIKTRTRKRDNYVKKEITFAEDNFNTSPDLSISNDEKKKIKPEDLQASIHPAEGEKNTRQATITQLFKQRAAKDAEKANMDTQPIPTTSTITSPIIPTTVQLQSPFFSSPPKSSSQSEGELIKNKGKEAMSLKETKEADSGTDSKPTVRPMVH
nr:retrovirus-related Pol polyprotein from transposon TNT 1-94 [Tanacetum cinerariifolium]